MQTLIWTSTVAVATLLSACVTSGKRGPLPTRPETIERVSLRKAVPERCAAIRGNGELIMAHFGALGALVEKVGVFDGLAGGSSASITMFLYESIVGNPVVWNCEKCDDRGKALRVALLLKSVPEYLEVLGDTSEAKALLGASSFLSKVQERGILKLLFSPSENQVVAGIGKLREALNSAELGDLVNPELRAMLSPTRVLLRTYQAREAFDAIREAGKPDPSKRKTFFRPGLLSFPMIAQKLGRLGGFYAGYGDFADQQGLSRFLLRCAPLSAGLDWYELAKKDPSCQLELRDLMKRHRASLLANEDRVHSRIKDRVGEATHVLVTTAILQGADARVAAEGFDRYLNDREFDRLEFQPYSRLSYGYWGHPQDLGSLAQNRRSYQDLRTRKTLPLWQASWETALSHSPAEPGLDKIHLLDETGEIPAELERPLASAAGWVDLAPVLALRNIGCRDVYYVTRRGEDSPFGRGIARALGMKEAEEEALYSLNREDSSFSLSLREATAVWCTDWNAFSVTQIPALVRDAHRSPLVRNSSREIIGCGGSLGN